MSALAEEHDKPMYSNPNGFPMADGKTLHMEVGAHFPCYLLLPNPFVRSLEQASWPTELSLWAQSLELS